MAPDAPGNLIVIDLRFEDGELKGESQSVEYSQEHTEEIEAAGGWFIVLWNETPRGEGFTPIGGGVVYVQSLPAGYRIRPPSPAVPDSLGGDRWAYRYPALGEGLMFVLVLPEGYTLVAPKPMPKSAKVFKVNRLAVYWKPDAKYGAQVKITWGLKLFDEDVRVERNKINSEIEKSENVPDNPGVEVDPVQGPSASEHKETVVRRDPPGNPIQAFFRILWELPPRKRLLLLLLVGSLAAGFAFWNSLPESTKQQLIEWLLRRGN